MSELYAKHVDRLTAEISAAATEVGFERVIFAAGDEQLVSRFDDQHRPFAPTPAFAHWLHLPEPGAAVVLRPGDKPRLHRTPPDSYWEAPPPPPPAWMLEPFEVVGGTPEIGGGRTAFVGNDPAPADAWGADAANPSELLTRLDAIRARKSDYEVECIAEANRRAARGHVALAEAFAAGGESELELHLRYLAVTEQDATETPYSNIVAVNRNAAVLHHIRYDRERRPGDASLLVDAGATCYGYAADITRTHARGDGAARFGELVLALETMQQTLCSEVEVGISFEVLHDRTHELLAGVARDIGLASASADELVESGFTRALLPHGLGHSLGIQVHDVGCRIKPPAERNPFLRNTASIEVGHVFTVEPGCYFIDALLDPHRAAPISERIDWALIDLLRPFGGIRIEDNIAVIGPGSAANGGSRNLTREVWPA